MAKPQRRNWTLSTDLLTLYLNGEVYMRYSEMTDAARRFALWYGVKQYGSDAAAGEGKCDNDIKARLADLKNDKCKIVLTEKAFGFRDPAVTRSGGGKTKMEMAAEAHAKLLDDGHSVEMANSIIKTLFGAEFVPSAD